MSSFDDFLIRKGKTKQLFYCKGTPLFLLRCTYLNLHSLYIHFTNHSYRNLLSKKQHVVNVPTEQEKSHFFPGYDLCKHFAMFPKCRGVEEIWKLAKNCSRSKSDQDSSIICSVGMQENQVASEKSTTSFCIHCWLFCYCGHR